MQHNRLNISQILVSLCRKKLTSDETELLANNCLKIAVVYLRILEQRGKGIRESFDNKEFHGIASDSIADLFILGKDGTLKYFRRYFDSCLKNNATDEERFLALRKLVTMQVRQHLSKLYAARDPEGAKLIRNIRLAAKRFRELKVNRNASGEYISFTNAQIKSLRFVRPDYFELKRAFSVVSRADYSVDKLVFEVLFRLSNDFECFVEVLIFDLAKLIREYRFAVEKNENTESKNDPLHYQRELELKKRVIEIVNKLNQKISNKYITKNKLTMDEGIAMSKALRDMANDALQGERLQENFYYLQKHWISLSREVYFTTVRKIFEYFVRLFKEEIRKIAENSSE